MQLPGHLVADNMCFDMPLSNQTLKQVLVAVANGKALNKSRVIMLDSHCFSGDCKSPNLFCVMKFSLNVFETKTVHLYWDYLLM
jgi:hypothetical protein